MTEHLRERSAYNPVNENGEGTLKKPRVLFICTPQFGPIPDWQRDTSVSITGDLFEAGSAGTGVRTVHPLAVLVMDEIGIDISGYRSKLIDEFFDQGADIVVTVCDSVTNACPFFPGAKTVLHAGFPDPSACTGSPDECFLQFRQVRDAIIAWIDTTLVPAYGKKERVREVLRSRPHM